MLVRHERPDLDDGVTDLALNSTSPHDDAMRFSARSGVSKKATCRNWASNGSMPSAARADRRLASGTLSFNSTLSAPLISPRTSAICSADKRLSDGPAPATASVVSVALLIAAPQYVFVSPQFAPPPGR